MLEGQVVRGAGSLALPGRIRFTIREVETNLHLQLHLRTTAEFNLSHISFRALRSPVHRIRPKLRAGLL